MPRLAPALPLLAALVPALALVLELAFPPTDAGPRAVARLVAAASIAPSPPAAPVADWVHAILARPLLRRDRRPPAPPSGAAAPGMAALPRLSGVLISSTDRFAIFAAADGTLTVAREGARVGAYAVVAIGEGEVTVLGPDGRRVLRPRFAQTGAAAGPSAAKPLSVGPRPPFAASSAGGTSGGGASKGGGGIIDMLHAGRVTGATLPPPPSLDSLLKPPPR